MVPWCVGLAGPESCGPVLTSSKCGCSHHQVCPVSYFMTSLARELVRPCDGQQFTLHRAIGNQRREDDLTRHDTAVHEVDPKHRKNLQPRAFGSLLPRTVHRRSGQHAERHIPHQNLTLDFCPRVTISGCILNLEPRTLNSIALLCQLLCTREYADGNLTKHSRHGPTSADSQTPSYFVVCRKDAGLRTGELTFIKTLLLHDSEGAKANRDHVLGKILTTKFQNHPFPAKVFFH